MMSPFAYNKCHLSLTIYLPVVVLLFLYILPITTLNAQERRKSKTVLFGVSLSRNAKAISLLSEVEQAYEKEVQEEWIEPREDQCGNSKVGDDGTPIIWINPACGRNIETIVHELYHFKMRTQGYPTLEWLAPAYMNSEANRAAFKQLTQQLYDPILHNIFFGEVRTWGINPGGAEEKRAKQGLRDNTLTTTITNMDKRAIALSYFKIRLEINDSALFQKLVELERQQNPSGIELGNRLAQIVIDANPRSPEEAIKTLVDCLNTYYEGQFRFKERPWSSVQLGRHIQRRARIELEPIR